MILVDANLLVYAYSAGAREHERARDWLDERLRGRGRVGLPWESIVAFLRIVTHPRLYTRPVTAETAWRQVAQWLSSPVAWVPQPTERHDETLATLLALTRVAGPHVHDAHLAALALQHGLLLCSTDADFARYPGLRWENPLAA
ncbi:MAG TPA: TA system VapC family ribonuclease toxin [Gaiellaceae bacterium]|nr:TA system VapC family ribonuclease toxin [Gaiellaceae bacterium]